MNILIIGAKGFIGSTIKKAFSVENFCLGIDLEKPEETDDSYVQISGVADEKFEKLFLKYDFDVCINASGSASVMLSMKKPLMDAKANCFNVYYILDFIRKYAPKTLFIQLSSAAVYGNPISCPVDEKDPLVPISVYGFNKRNAEYVCEMYSTLFGIRVCVMRIFSLYGVGQKNYCYGIW